MKMARSTTLSRFAAYATRGFLTHFAERLGTTPATRFFTCAMVAVACNTGPAFANQARDSAIDVQPEHSSATVGASTNAWYAYAKPARRIVSLAPNREVAVRWRVVTRDRGLRLRLYAGHGLGTPVLLADAEAIRGDYEYSLRDQAPSEGLVRYELRCVDSSGQEVSLGVILGFAPILASHSSNLTVTHSIVGDLVGRPEAETSLVGFTEERPRPRCDRFALEVPTPPPRSRAFAS